MLKKARITGGALLVSVVLSALLGVVYLVLAQEGDPNLPPVVDLSADFALAAQLAETKDYAQAEAIYREIIADYPGTDHALAAQKGLALAAMARKDWDTAVSEADVLIAQYPTNPQLAQALYGIARQFERNGKSKKAFRYYQACLEHNPSAELALEVKSKVVVFHAEAMDYATANTMLADLKAALPVGEDLGKTICVVGRAISINAYNHKHANEEANNDAHRLALAYFQEAEQMFQANVPTWRSEHRAIESRFGIINSYWALGLKQDEAAAEDELMAQYACGEGGTFLSEVLVALARRHRTVPGNARAMQLYQHALNNCSGCANEMDLLVDLAQLNIALKDYPAAQALVGQLQAGYSDRPGFIGRMNELAWDFRKVRMFGDAETIYRHILANRANDSEAIYTQSDLVALKHSAGDKDATAAELDVLISQFPDNNQLKADLLRKLAFHTFEQTKDYATAARLFALVAELTPDPKVAQQVKLEYFRPKSRLIQTAAEAEELFQACLTAIAGMSDKYALRYDAIQAVFKVYMSYHTERNGVPIEKHVADLLLEAVGAEATDLQKAAALRNVAKVCRALKNYAAAAELFRQAMTVTSNAELVQELTIEDLNMRALLVQTSEEAEQVFQSCLAVMTAVENKKVLGHHAYAIADVVKAYVTHQADKDGVPVAIDAANRLIAALGNAASVEEKAKVLGTVAKGCADTKAYQTAEELFLLAAEESPDPNHAQRVMLEYLKMRTGMVQTEAEAEEVFQDCLEIILTTTDNNILVRDAIEYAVRVYGRIGRMYDNKRISIESADRLISALGTGSSIYKIAMARHVRSWALVWNGMYEEATQLLVDIVDEYSDTGDEDVEYLRAVSLGHAYGFTLAKYRDPNIAQIYLDDIRELWPDGRYDSVASYYRDRFQVYEK